MGIRFDKVEIPSQALIDSFVDAHSFQTASARSAHDGRELGNLSYRRLDDPLSR